MTTRNRVRTPKKSKIWTFVRANTAAITDTISPFSYAAVDLLQEFLTDRGLLLPAKATVMRILGHLHYGNAAGAAVSEEMALGWGIAWIRREVADGTPSEMVPDPINLGTRQTEWINRGILRHRSTAGTEKLSGTDGCDAGWIRFDIRQMRTQPTGDHRLMLVLNHTAGADSDPIMSYDFSTMLALP